MARTTSLQLAKKQEDHGVATNTHPYKLPIPNPIYDELQEETRREHRTLYELIKRYLKMGLKIDKIQREDGAELIVRRPGMPDERITFL